MCIFLFTVHTLSQTVLVEAAHMEAADAGAAVPEQQAAVVEEAPPAVDAAVAAEQAVAEQAAVAEAAAPVADSSLKRPADEDVGEPDAKRLHMEPPAING